MSGFGSACDFVQSVTSKLRGRKNLKRQRCPDRQGPLFEVLEQRLYLSASAAAFATSALADYSPKPPVLMMPLAAGTDQAGSKNLGYTSQLPQANAAQTNASNATLAPLVSNVTFTAFPISGQSYYNWQITIVGSGFGTQAPFNGDSSDIIVADTTSNWSAGYSGNDDAVSVNVINWSNTEIQIDGLTGSYGTNNWIVNPGDSVEVQIANPNTDQASNIYQLTAPAALSTVGQWSASSLPTAGGGMGAISVGSDIILSGASYYSSTGWVNSNAMEVYNTSTDKWSTTTLPGTATAGGAWAAVGNDLIIAGGASYSSGTWTPSAAVNIYNVSTGQWSIVPALSQARWGMAAATVGDLAIFAGGATKSNGIWATSAAVDIYNMATNQWTTAELSVPRYGLAATTVGDLAIFAGGADSTYYGAASNASDAVDIYNASTGQWSTTSLSEARGYVAATTVGGDAIFAGGETHMNDVVINGNYLPGTGSYAASDVVDIYNSNTNEWTTAGLPQAREGMSATSSGNLAFFAGGDTQSTTAVGNYSDMVNIFNVNTDQWSVAELSQSRFGIASAAVGDLVMFAGGLYSTSGNDWAPSNIIDWYNTSSSTVPAITAVAPTAASMASGGYNWGFAIQGSGFGTQSAFDVANSYLNLSDATSGFSAGYTGDAVTADVTSWTDTSIGISSLTGSYGQGKYVIQPGDQMTLTVMNPQTGLVSNQYQFTMPATTPGTNAPAISNVSIQPLSGGSDNWSVTITGSNFGTQNPFSTTSPNLLVLDTTNNMPAGNTGDTVTANVTSWTDSQIVIQSFGGDYGQLGMVINPGDNLSITVTNPQTGEQGSLAVTVPSAVAPVISNVSFQPNNGDWVMTVVGSGFGTQPTFTDGTTPYLKILDTTDGQSAGYTGDLAKVTVTSWTDTSIEVTGFAGDNTGLNLVVINPGDAITVTVWNPQTKVESAAYSTTVPGTPGSPPAGDTQVAVSVSGDESNTWTVGFSAGNFSTTYTISAQLLQGILQAAQSVQDIESLLGDVPGFHIQTSIQNEPALGFSLSGDLYFSPTGKLDAVSLTDGISATGLGATIEGYFGLSFLNVGIGVEATVAAGINGTISLIGGNLALSEGGYLSGTLQGFAEATMALWEGKGYVQGTLTANVAASSAGYVSAALTASGQVGVELDSIPLFGGSPSPIWNASYGLGSYPLGQWSFNIGPLIQSVINNATGAFDSYLGNPQTSSTLAAAPLLATSSIGSTSSISLSALTLSLASNTVSHTMATAPTLNARQPGIVQTINATHSSTADSTTSTVTRHPIPGFVLISTNRSSTLYFAGFASAPSVQAPGVGFEELGGRLLPNILESPLTVGSLWVA